MLGRQVLPPGDGKHPPEERTLTNTGINYMRYYDDETVVWGSACTQK